MPFYHTVLRWACFKQSLHVEGSPGSIGFLQPGNWSFSSSQVKWTPPNLSSLSCNNFLEAAGTSHTCPSHLTFELKTGTQPVRKYTNGGPNLPYGLFDRISLRMLRFQTKVISIGQQRIHFSWPHILKSTKIKSVHLPPQFAWDRFLQLRWQTGSTKYTFSFSFHHSFYHKPFSDNKLNIWIALISLTKN